MPPKNEEQELFSPKNGGHGFYPAMGPRKYAPQEREAWILPQEWGPKKYAPIEMGSRDST